MSTRNAILKKMINGSLTNLANSTYTGGGAGMPYDIQLSNTAATTSVIVNGGGVFTSTATGEFSSGKIGLYTYYNPVCFDDIQVEVQSNVTRNYEVENLNSSIVISPVPFDRNTNISMQDEALIESILVISNDGKRVINKTNINSPSISFGEELGAGFYTVQVKTKDKLVYLKVIKL